MKCGLFPNSAYMSKEDLRAYSLLAQQAKSNHRNVCVWTLHAGVQLHCGEALIQNGWSLTLTPASLAENKDFQK